MSARPSFAQTTRSARSAVAHITFASARIAFSATRPAITSPSLPYSQVRSRRSQTNFAPRPRAAARHAGPRNMLGDDATITSGRDRAATRASLAAIRLSAPARTGQERRWAVNGEMRRTGAPWNVGCRRPARVRSRVRIPRSRRRNREATILPPGPLPSPPLARGWRQPSAVVRRDRGRSAHRASTPRRGGRSHFVADSAGRFAPFLRSTARGGGSPRCSPYRRIERTARYSAEWLRPQ